MAGKRYDVESLIDDIKLAITDATRGLNAKLTAIDSEKADFVIKKLNANAIAIFEADASTLIYDPNLTILVSSDDPLDNAVGGHAVDVEIWITVRDTAEKAGVIERRVFRYMRALYEIFVKDRDKLQLGAVARVSTIGYFGDPTEGRNVERKTVLTGGIILQCRLS